MTDRRLFPTTADLLSSDALAALLHAPVRDVDVTPFQISGMSTTDSAFLGVRLNGEHEPSLLLKQMRRECDWVAIATDDTQGRAAAIWQHGVLDRFPRSVDHAIVGCTEPGVGPDILMRNVQPYLLRQEQRLTERDHDAVLDGMAALHAEFWNDDALREEGLHLCEPARLLLHTAERTAREAAAVVPSGILEVLQEGWRVLPDLVDPAVHGLLTALADDPEPLCSALEDVPGTLVHGDLHPGNLGLVRGIPDTVVMLDMARPTRTAAGVDLAWHLALSVRYLPGSKESAITSYRRHLERHLGERLGDDAWALHMDIALLAGFLMAAPIKAYRAAHAEDPIDRDLEQRDLPWWSRRARHGARRLAS